MNSTNSTHISNNQTISYITYSELLYDYGSAWLLDSLYLYPNTIVEITGLILNILSFVIFTYHNQ
jgi:hypothetical protein